MTCKQERGKLSSKWEQIRFFNHNISNNQLLILTVKIIDDQLELLGGQHLNIIFKLLWFNSVYLTLWQNYPNCIFN